jgi:hypothetical protein
MQVGISLVIGVLSTLAYAVLYLGLRTRMGPWRANFIALFTTALVNTAANPQFTFGVRGPQDVVRHQLQGLLIFAAGLLATSGSLALVHAAGSSSRAVEVIVLTTTNLAVAVVRFVAMKLWVFVRRPVTTAPVLSRRARVPGSAAERPTASSADPRN